MKQHIIQYWIDYFFGFFTLSLGFVCKILWSRYKTLKKENNGIKHGVRALLHNEIIRMGNELIAKGYCTSEEFEELMYLYTPYSEDLEGNGSAERAVEKVKALPQSKKN